MTERQSSHWFAASRRSETALPAESELEAVLRLLYKGVYEENRMTNVICSRGKMPSALHWAVFALALAMASGAYARSASSNGAALQDQSPQAAQEKGDKQDKDASAGMTKLKIQVNDANGKAVSNASVYIGFYESGGFLRHDKMAELDLKTNQDGSVKVPEIPQGKIRIQVIAKGWHTFGQWYDIEKPAESVEIKLQQPPHWY